MNHQTTFCMFLKSILLTLGMLSFFASYSQQEVFLRINHLLGNEAYAAGKTVSSAALDGANDYQISRLEYYIGEIELTYDSGQTMSIPNKYIIVDPNQQTNELLGSFQINSIEGISFSIGVDSITNHSDPSLFANDHPLGNRFPSMHWGWIAGYRFVAIDGWTGSNLNQLFSVHALGDENYHRQSHSLTGFEEDSALYISLDADYTAAFNSIIVNPDLSNHGAFGPSITLLENFRDYVFTSSIVGISELEESASEFKVYPNPSNGIFSILAENGKIANRNMNYQIKDVSGRIVEEGVIDLQHNNQIKIQKSGVYMITLRGEDNGKLVINKKLVVQ